MKKRIFALLAVLVLLISAAGCENVEYPSESSQSESSSDNYFDSILSQLPDIIDGDELQEKTFLIITNDEKVFYQDESSPGAINTAIEERNSLLRQKYGAIVEVQTESYNKIAKDLAAALQSGRQYCDMLSISAKNTVKLYVSGLLQDLNSLPDFNVENSYFDSRNAKALATNSTLYLLPDPTNLYYEEIYCMFFNRDLLKTKGCADVESLAMQGKWTWDSYNEAYRTAANEVINKSIANLDTDTFGFAAYHAEGTHPLVMWSSCGRKLVDNTYKNSVGLSLSVDEIIEIAGVLDNSYDSKAKLPIDGSGAAAAFEKGRLAFFVNKLDYITALRNGTDKGGEFGILPMPKYNESQESYSCLVSNDARVISAPKTLENADESHRRFVSAVISATCAAGGKTMHDTYLNNVIGSYLFNNAESVMFKTVMESATFDFANVFGSQISEIRRSTTAVIVDYIDVGSAIRSSIDKAIDSFRKYSATKFT